MQTISDELSRLQVIELDAGQIFSGNPSGTPIKGYATPSLYTPRLDPNYLFHESSRDIIVWLLSPEEPLYIFGPSGCGKTSCVKQLAARLNYPLFEVTGHMVSWTVLLCVSRKMVGNSSCPIPCSDSWPQPIPMAQGMTPVFTRELSDRTWLLRIDSSFARWATLIPLWKRSSCGIAIRRCPYPCVKRWWTMPMKSAGCSWER